MFRGLGSCVDSLGAPKGKERGRGWRQVNAGHHAARPWSVGLRGSLLPPAGAALSCVLPASLATRTDPAKPKPNQ